jgi:hypothetical protein
VLWVASWFFLSSRHRTLTRHLQSCFWHNRGGGPYSSRARTFEVWDRRFPEERPETFLQHVIYGGIIGGFVGIFLRYAVSPLLKWFFGLFTVPARARVVTYIIADSESTLTHVHFWTLPASR